MPHAEFAFVTKKFILKHIGIRLEKAVKMGFKGYIEPCKLHKDAILGRDFVAKYGKRSKNIAKYWVKNRIRDGEDPDSFEMEILQYERKPEKRRVLIMKFDRSDEAIALVQSQLWHVNMNGYAGTYTNDKHPIFHKMLTSFDFTDHKNRDRLDNRMCNLRVTNFIQNAHNLTCKNTKIPGKYPGIYRNREKGRPNYHWSAEIWYNKKHYKKTFSIQKYGEAKAKKLAALARVDLCKRFNSMNDCPTEEDLADIDLEIAKEIAEVNLVHL